MRFYLSIFLFLFLGMADCTADTVKLYFLPPTEYTNNQVLADGEITNYKWNAYGSGNVVLDTVFTNTGDMREVTFDLIPDRYLICLHAQAQLWSLPACTYVNMFEPRQPKICN